MYITFEAYSGMGGSIDDSNVFARYAARADSVIDRMTHGRIRDETPVRSCAQYAAYALIEQMRADDESAYNGRAVTGMSNDGVSVSFATSGDAGMDRARRYAAIVSDYLQYETDANGTLVLYAGVDA